MAESSDNKSLFNCPICLHLLNNPVTTYCGHSFCMDCLNEFWDRDTLKGVYSCPQCRQTFTPRPALSKNTVIAEVVERMKIETPEKATHVLRVAVSGDVECDICTETKLKAIKSCLVCLASYCESHIQTHYTSPALKRHKLVNASPHLLDQICPQHDKLLELYCCKDQQLICMQCALINHQNHKMTSPAAERQNIQLQGQLKAKLDRLNTEMHDREKKIQELRDAMNFHGLNSKAVVEQSEKMFTEQISSMMERKTKIANMIRCKEKAEVSKIEELIVTVEQEISDLRRRHEELGQLSEVEDDIYFIQKFSSLTAYVCTNLQKIAIRQHMTFKEIEMIICDLKSQLDDLCTQDVTRILEKVSAVYLMVTVLKPWVLIATLLLHNPDGLDLSSLTEQTDWLRHLALAFGAFLDWPDHEPCTEVIHSSLALHRHLLSISAGHVQLSATDSPQVQMSAEEAVFHRAVVVLSCASYRNQILHVFLRPALLAVAMQSANSSRKDDIYNCFSFLRNMFSNEFILCPGDSVQDFEEACYLLMKRGVLQVLEHEIVMSADGHSTLAFLCTVLDPFLQGYQVVCRYLCEETNENLTEKEFIPGVRDFALKLILGGRLTCFEVLSSDLQKNVLAALLRLNAVRKLKVGDQVTLKVNKIAVNSLEDTLGGKISTQKPMLARL